MNFSLNLKISMNSSPDIEISMDFSSDFKMGTIGFLSSLKISYY